MVRIIPFFSGCFFFLVSGCWCNDQIRSTSSLNETELNLVELPTPSTLNYFDNLGNSYTAITSYDGITSETDRLGAESCDIDAFERASSRMFFTTENLPSVSLDMDSPINNGSSELTLDIRGKDLAGNNIGVRLLYFNQTGSSFTSSQFQTISLNGMTFNDVIVVNDSFSNSPVDKVLMSLENGIELILFDDGNFLKLDI